MGSILASGGISANDLSAWLVYALNMLDVRRLRVLREVAAHGSFSAAAEALAFTQPAVSRQIATLETEAGTRLVERSARGVRLPGRRAAGRPRRRDPRPPDRGREPARGALPARGRPPAHRRARDRQRDPDPARGTRVRRGAPRGRLRLDEAISSELIDRLAAGDLDIAIVADADRLTELPGELVLEPLMDDPLHLAVPHDHPLATAKRVRMADLEDEVSIEGRDPAAR